MKKNKKLTLEEKQAILSRSALGKGLASDAVKDLSRISDLVVFKEAGVVSNAQDGYTDVIIVISGLIRVSISSSSGRRITTLLVKAGECYNVLSPYLAHPRQLEASALETTRCLRIKGDDFICFVKSHPDIISNLIRIVGSAFDSANSRILDFMDKKVDKRIMRVLSTLYGKFGSPIHFTSVEISEIAGTTPESTLRAMGRLRDLGIIETRRGVIRILDANALNNPEFGTLQI